MSDHLSARIGPIGYGLMGLTWRPDSPTQPESFELMNTAIACGATFFNGGEIYGTPVRNSCHLLKEFFEAFPENPSKLTLSIKGGMKQGSQEPDASEKNLRRSVDECNRILAGTKKIDIFECARVDAEVPVEESINTLACLVNEGKIGGIGLIELSLWTTNILHNGIANTCAELGIPIVAYAPLSRGALTTVFGLTNEDLPVHRRNFPKFQNEALAANHRLTEEVEKLGVRKDCKPSQIARAWIKGLNALRPKSSPIIPISSAERPEWIQENCRSIHLKDKEMKEIGEILKRSKTSGERYMGLLAAFLSIEAVND